jgi:hypothetical protein
MKQLGISPTAKMREQFGIVNLEVHLSYTLQFLHVFQDMSENNYSSIAYSILNVKTQMPPRGEEIKRLHSDRILEK